MKKIILGLIVSCVLVSQSAMAAEDSGAFLGVGVGFGGYRAKANSVTSTTIDMYNSSTTTYDYSSGNTKNSIRLNYEIIAGYKQAITDNFGVKYYANINFSDFKYNYYEYFTEKMNILNYTFNVDGVFDIIYADAFKFGLSAGIGVGGNTIFDSGADSLATGLDVGFNAGVHIIIAKHHGIEFAVRVPVIATSIRNLDYNYSYLTHTYTDDGGETYYDYNTHNHIEKTRLYHNYNISVRYVYHW